MKYKFTLLILLIFIFHCSKKDNVSSEVTPIVTGISSNTSFIGDTLTLIGQNLNKPIKVRVEQYKPYSLFLDCELISKTENELKFVIPEIFDKSIRVYSGNDNPVFDVELYGYIPISRRYYDDSPFRNMRVAQIVNDDLAFFIPESEGLVKTSNNFDSQEYLDRLTGIKVVDCYFFDTSRGWIVTYENESSSGGDYKFYFTNDGGNTISLKNTLPSTAIEPGGIYSVQYTNENSGFLKTWNQTFYKIDGSNIEKINSVYPELTTNTNYEDGVYADYKILNDGTILLFTPINYLNVQSIIRIEGNSVSQIDTNGIPLDITFFDNHGFFYTTDKIYESMDYGKTWNEFSGVQDWSSNSEFMFLKILSPKQFLRRTYHNPKTSISTGYEISIDAGRTWENCLYLPWENIQIMDMGNNFGLAYGDRRYFKFRKFLE